MTWHLTLLLCLEMLDGTAKCEAYRSPYTFPTESSCWWMASEMIRVQAQAPDGYRWLLPTELETCSTQRYDLPMIPSTIEAWSLA